MQNICFLAKLLVSTGSPVDNGVVSEVLDLQNATNICSPMSDFPIKTSQVESIGYSNFRSGQKSDNDFFPKFFQFFNQLERVVVIYCLKSRQLLPSQTQIHMVSGNLSHF